MNIQQWVIVRFVITPFLWVAQRIALTRERPADGCGTSCMHDLVGGVFSLIIFAALYGTIFAISAIIGDGAELYGLLIIAGVHCMLSVIFWNKL